MLKFYSKEDGFIVPVLYWIFIHLEKISFFHFIRFVDNKYYEQKERRLPELEGNPFTSEYIFPEIWVFLNMIIALIVSPFVLKHSASIVVAYMLGIYAMLRVLELVVYQVNVLFFHRLKPYYEQSESDSKSEGEEEYAIKSATRTVILLILNMVEYIAQFSVMFMAIKVVTNNPSIPVTIHESFLFFNNSGELEACHEKVALMLVYAEILIGLFMNVVCLARFVGLLPDVKTKGP